jgi:hypothetical protein
VHCRLSALGRVVGGAETVVRALLDTVGPRGTLVAYTGWDDAPPDDLDALSPMDRDVVLTEQPPYDPEWGVLAATTAASPTRPGRGRGPFTPVIPKPESLPSARRSSAASDDPGRWAPVAVTCSTPAPSSGARSR